MVMKRLSRRTITVPPFTCSGVRESVCENEKGLCCHYTKKNTGKINIFSLRCFSYKDLVVFFTYVDTAVQLRYAVIVLV